MGLKIVHEEPPEWVNDGPPLEEYDRDFGIEDIPEAAPWVQPEPVVPDVVEKEKTVEAAIPVFAEAEDESECELNDFWDGWGRRVEAIEQGERFRIFTGSPDELAARAIIDVCEGLSYPVDRKYMMQSEIDSLSVRVLMVYTEGAFFVYSEVTGTWKRVDDNEIKRAIRNYSGFEYGPDGKTKSLHMTSGILNSAFDLVKVRKGESKFFDWRRKDGLPMRSGFWSVRKGQIVMGRHSPRNMIYHSYPFDWPDDALFSFEQYKDLDQWPALDPFWDRYCPRWVWFLRNALENREDDARCIQDWTAATVTGQAPQKQKALMCIGEGGNGKGTLIKAIMLIMPRGASVTTNPGNWTQDYHRSVLIGKLMAFCTETDAFRKVDALKAVITGDPIETRFTGAKSSEPFQYIPTVGMIFSANALPTTKLDAALTDRFEIIEFKRKFRDSATQVAENRLLASFREELPGILFWLMCGLVRISKTNKITRASSTDVLLEQWRYEADPVKRFIQNRCVQVPGVSIASITLYNAFRDWCVRFDGLKEKDIIAHEPFGRKMSSYGFKSERKGSGDTQARVFQGISLKALDTARSDALPFTRA